MCGFTGFLTKTAFNFEEAKGNLLKMRDCLVHRGPDDAGIWLDPDAGIAFGHRRLSIVDLSSTGHQPMISQSGRFILAFNGEIYNHNEIRKQLEVTGKIQWRGLSDTESLLFAIEHWGLERALKASIGMFSLSLWDRQERVLSLARDRMGEKPLYYGWQNGTLLFGSELKALRMHPAFESEINRDVLPLYFKYGYFPSPWCVWRGIRKLLPGTWITFRTSDYNADVQPESYWSNYESALRGQSNLFKGSDIEAIDELEVTLKQAVAGQMVADVKLGAFLSGGIDSSTIVALMQAQSSHRVKTFTIGFHEKFSNEAIYAKAVATHLGTEHTELYVTADGAREVIPSLSQIYDEPFGDSSAIPTFIVSQLARQHVAVSLSGDGGDELFGGYGRYFRSKEESNWASLRAIPEIGRLFLSKALQSQIPVYFDLLLHNIAKLSNKPIGKSLVAKCSLTADLINCSTHAEYYRVINSLWNPTPLLNSGTLPVYGLSSELLSVLSNPLNQMMSQDIVTYLPDDILTKVDRAAMAVSLETRVPMLDHRVVELAWRMPYNLKVRNGEGKWIIKQLLKRHIPDDLVKRPKMGFGIPVDQWLRGSLKEWGEELLDKRRLEQEGFLNANLIRKRWTDHQIGRHNWRDSLWLVMMWQSWLEKNN